MKCCIVTIMALLYATRATALDFREVIAIFSDPETDKISQCPPQKPEGGTIYVTNNRKDATCDQYLWVNRGGKKVPKSEPVYFRRDYKVKRFVGDVVGDDGFQRKVYFAQASDLVIIHYIGDKGLYMDRPHGNAKSMMQKYRRTLPSALDNIKNESGCIEPARVYRDSVTQSGISAHKQGIKNARNRKQVENVRYVINKSKKLTHDAAYNCLELAYTLDSFVLEFSLFPELKVVVGNREILLELDRLLASENQALLSYDTTFNLGDFFVSALTVKHPFFTGKVCVPVAFLIHDRKNQKCHDTFWREITSAVPHFSVGRPVVVTDREPAFSNAIKRHIPNCKLIFCWNHIRADVKRWVKEHGGKSDDVAVYCEDIDTILRSENENAFDESCQRLSALWSQSFVDHFNANLKSTVKLNCSRFMLEELGLYDHHSGITNNISESINRVFKDLLEWRQVPLDSVILALNYLQDFHVLEVKRGYCDVGDFQLKPEHRRHLRDPETVVLPQNTMKPADIVSFVKGQLTVQCMPEGETVISDTTDETLPQGSSAASSTSPTGNQESELPTGSSQRALAANAIRQNMVFHCAAAASFVVMGTKGDKYSVSLHPSEKCVCPALGTCWHILAARMSVGLEFQDGKKIRNLTQLARNCRKRPNKNAGKKRPRPIDKEDEERCVVPAPDSVAATPSCPSPLVVGSLSPNVGLKNATPRKRLKYITETSDQVVINLSTIEEETGRDADACDTVDDPIWTENGSTKLLNSHRDKISNQSELCSDIINHSMALINNQFSHIYGLQQSELVPTYDDTTQNWNYEFRFQPVQLPSAQVHHTGTDHWVLSIQTKDGKVYLFDSMWKNKLSASLTIQLGQLYYVNTITIPNVQQQRNSIDCGLFALAFLVEFCFSNSISPKCFDDTKLRPHLLECLENKHFTQFPTKKSGLKLRKSKHVLVYDLDLDCDECRLPNIYDNMVECKTEECEVWAHYRCKGITTDNVNSKIYICKSCSNTN